MSLDKTMCLAQNLAMVGQVRHRFDVRYQSANAVYRFRRAYSLEGAECGAIWHVRADGRHGRGAGAKKRRADDLSVI